MCKEIVKAAQALMEPNVARAPKTEVLIHKELEKQGDKEPKPITGPRPDTILSLDHRVVPNTTDESRSMALMPIPEVEEPWPQSLWETIKNKKDGSATLQSAPIPEIVLDNEFYPGDIQSLYGDAGTKVSMDTVKTTTIAASSRTTRSTKKSSSDDERTDTYKDQGLEESDQEDSQKAAEAPRPLEHEQSDEEDTSTPLDKKSKKPRTIEQFSNIPRQEDEEELENIQVDPLPSFPKSVPPAPPSSPKTPAPPPSSQRTPPSPKSPGVPKSPPAPASPQQQQHYVEPPLVPPSSQLQDKPNDLEKEKEDEDRKQADTTNPKPVGKELQFLVLQLEEPTSKEAYEEVKTFDYTKIILTLSRQFQCQKVVAKETDFQKERADQVYEEIEKLQTALQLVTKERDSDAQENKNILKDLLDVHSQLDRKESQCHELVKNEKKLKDQLRAGSSCGINIGQSIMNTLTTLQEELQTKKLQRQLLVFGFMTQTQHKTRVKELEQELDQAKANLEIQKQRNEVLSKEKEAVGSLASTSQISQVETHLHVHLPPMPDMPDLPGTSQHDEEHQGLAAGALGVRGDLEQEIEDMPEGPTKEFLLHEKKVMELVALAFLQPEEQAKGLGHDFLPLPLMQHEAILWK
ncbi:hypothetical protein L7F22_042842 [Adiantum nelumboides]|nr:hypothetical protein [Adiantum nelumboides]